MNSLEILSEDLRLIAENGFKIYIAIDFADIFEYCYPFINMSKFTHHNEHKLDLILERQLSRTMLFFKLNNFYSLPILLLPPYLAESIDALKLLEAKLTEYDDINKRDYVTSIIEKYEIGDRSNANQINKILSLINEAAPELAFIFGASFREGFDIHKELMKDVIKPYAGNIRNYYNQILYISEMNNSTIEDIVGKIRSDRGSKINNKRDAKALQYVIELNKTMVLDKSVLILLSSAPHFQLLQSYYKELYMPIFGEEFCLLRNTEFLYVMLVELGEALGSNEDKIDLSQVEPKDLHRVVESHLKIVKGFYDVYEAANAFGLSGKIKEEFINNYIDIIEFNKLIDRRKKLNVMTLINEFLVDDNRIDYFKKININEDNIIITLKKLKTL
jgi:hypothetical protein